MRHFKIALVVLVFVLIAAAAFRFGEPLWKEHVVRSTSDAKDIQGKIKIAVDSWIGYFPLCSLELRERMKREGWQLQCEDDKADYAKRMKRLAAGEIDFA